MKIIYDTDEKTLTTTTEEDLLEVCLKNKVDISHSCEGMASCGTCRIIVTDGVKNLPPRNQLEQEMANDRGFADHERLACQLPLSSSFRFKLPEDN